MLEDHGQAADAEYVTALSDKLAAVPNRGGGVLFQNIQRGLSQSTSLSGTQTAMAKPSIRAALAAKVPRLPLLHLPFCVRLQSHRHGHHCLKPSHSPGACSARSQTLTCGRDRRRERWRACAPGWSPGAAGCSAWQLLALQRCLAQSCSSTACVGP